MTVPLPDNEIERLKVLESYKILDTPPDQALDEITSLAASVCHTPISLVTLIDSKRQWFMSKVGLSLAETHRDFAFCAYTILDPDKEFCVPDATVDTRFRANPLVTGEPYMRFYYGLPLTSSSGLALGTLSVIDTVPRVLSSEQKMTLGALRRCVIAELELRRQASLVTNLYQTRTLHDAELYQLLWETTADAILILDHESVIRHASPAARRVFGYDPNELEGTSIAMLQPASLRESHRLGMARYLSSKKRTLSWGGTEITCLHRDGHEFPAEIMFSEMVLDNKSVFAGAIRDITKRKQDEENVRRFRAAMDAAEDSIFLTDSRTLNIIDVNDAACRSLGYSREELLRMQPADVHTQVSAASFRVHYERLVAGDNTRASIESVFRRNDGSTFPVEVNRRVLASATDPIIVSVARDISDRIAAREAIMDLNVSLEVRIAERTAQLQTANEELKAFSYTVSHDLRVPLRTIGAFAQIISDDHSQFLDDVAKDYLGRIHTATGHMTELVDGLLALSRAANGPLSVRSVDLSAIAKDILIDLQRAEPARRVEVFIADDMVAIGDRILLTQVLTNLLQNAWKYTSTTTAARISFDSFFEDRNRVYRIADNGAGFDPNYANKLFRPFERLHRASEFPGTGIGLATVKRIVVRHGGRIWATGVPDEGAIFYFTIGDGTRDV